MKSWWAAHRPTQRRLIQIYAALLYNAHARGFIEGNIFTGGTKIMCVPGLNCYSCPGAVGACPLGALQNALASANKRAPYYVLGILLLFGLMLGRTICGFLCPMGLIQELLHKLPTPKLPKSRVTRVLSWLKYVILAVFVLILPLVFMAENLAVPAFCKYICPAGTLEGALGLLIHPENSDKFSMLGALFNRKFIILAAVLAACVFIYRAFCRFLCPLGAIYSLFSRIALVGVRVKPADCTRCGRCVSSCPVDIRRVGDHECIQCGRCVSACPTGAIQWHAGRAEIRAGESAAKRRRRRIAWAAAIVLLAGVLVWVNLPAAAPAETVAVDESLPVGSEVGMRAPDFSAPLYGGGEFSLADCRGKVVVLNFWATWCGPCVKELPHFQELYEEYGADTALVAIHSNMVTEDVQAWLDAQDYSLPFALDPDGSVIASYGGSTMLPMTVVIDRQGVIRYNSVGSVTWEALEALVSPLV